MNIAHIVLSLLAVDPLPWHADWALGLPLIVLTVVIHVLGLLFIDTKTAHVESALVDRGGYSVMFVVIVGVTAMSAAALHGIEGVIWAAAFRLVGALPDNAEAFLYSLGAMTTYGHADLALEK